MNNRLREEAHIERRIWPFALLVAVVLFFANGSTAVDFLDRVLWVDVEADATMAVEAEVELVRLPSGGYAVEYMPDAPELVNAVWSVHGYLRDGTRLFTRRGDGYYGPGTHISELWTWQAFHEGYDTEPPAVPSEPFRLCVYYFSPTHSGTGLAQAGPYCTSFSDELEPDL